MHATWHVATGTLSKNTDIDHCGLAIRTANLRKGYMQREGGRKEDRELDTYV